MRHARRRAAEGQRSRMQLTKRQAAERLNLELKLPRLMSAKIKTTTPRPLAACHVTPRPSPSASPARPAAAARARVACPCPFFDFSS
jgi:hypothetical protein